MSLLSTTVAALTEQFGAESSEYRGRTRVVVTADSLREAMRYLHEEAGFDLLVDLTCVDYLEFRGAAHRFGLAYLLTNVAANVRLTVRVMLDEPHLTAPSVTEFWAGANWFEREVYDMFGVEFEGHPDLRRILMPPEFSAHPLRKDYPLQGRGERHNFPVITRDQA